MIKIVHNSNNRYIGKSICRRSESYVEKIVPMIRKYKPVIGRNSKLFNFRKSTNTANIAKLVESIVIENLEVVEGLEAKKATEAIKVIKIIKVIRTIENIRLIEAIKTTGAVKTDLFIKIKP